MNKARVLVVEDEALIALDIADALTDYGWEVVGPTGTIDEALELAASAAIDIAVMDVNLGSVKSYPVADVLARRNVPVLYLTGDQARDAPAGANGRHVLTKPVDYKVLNQFLRQQLAAVSGSDEATP